MRIRYISSPKLDYSLAPEEYRRYTNNMLGFFAFFLVVFFIISCPFIFGNYLNFLKVVYWMKKHEAEQLAQINMMSFYFRSLILGCVCIAPSWFLMNFFTKPVQRMVHVSGNFLDDSPQVVANLMTDFAFKTPSKTIALLRNGDRDFNINWKGNGKEIKKDLFLPKEIIECGTIIRGEAGAGKTIILDRLIKESINTKNKLILHSIKGDEIKKLDGFCSMYVIEPWNKKRGYALDFLNIIASNDKNIENAGIRTFCESFNKKVQGKEDFFSGGATSVTEAIVRSVVVTTKNNNGIVEGDLSHIVETWNGFQVQPVNLDIDLTDAEAVEKELDKNSEQLQIVKDFLLEWNPTATIYIDPQNAKTSLCVLASCIEIMRKFEVLASFWSSAIKRKKVLNIRDWLAKSPKADRQVIVLVNSNRYNDVANCYISAFINLTVNEVIEPSYDVKWQLHFMIDEFPQLTAIDIEKFLKLPDVGRSKGIRVMLALQRTSQIKNSFNMDGESFVSAFQNKIWCRMATDDLSIIEKELGKREVIKTKGNGNYAQQGLSTSSTAVAEKIDVINPHDMQNQLGPVSVAGKFQGVRALFKFANTPRVAMVLMPPVVFEKKHKRANPRTVEASAGGINNQGTKQQDESKDEILIGGQSLEHIVTTIEEPSELEHEAKNPLTDFVADQVAHAIGGEVATALLHATELAEAFQSTDTNNNITQTVVEHVEVKEVKKSALEVVREKNKKKGELQL